MNEETMRKHYETTPKDMLINILISGRKEFDKLQNRNKECKREIERLNKKIEQYENPEDITLMFMWCDEKAKNEIKRLNNIINEINSIVEYWGYDKEHNDISCFRMAMKSIKDILGSE